MAKKAKNDGSTGKMDRVAEGVGATLGHFLNQVEDQVKSARQQRDSTVRSLLAIRGKATKLLADLGHTVMEVPLPRIGRKPGRPRKTEGSAVPPAVKATARKKKRSPMSPEGRARIAEAQRARWAKLKAAKKSGNR